MLNIIRARAPPINAVISCIVPMANGSCLTILGAKFRPNICISLVAERYMKTNLTKAPISIPMAANLSWNFSFDIFLNKPQKTTSNALPTMIKGMKAAKGKRSCPTNKARTGVSTPTATPQPVPHMKAAIIRIALTTGPTRNWFIMLGTNLPISCMTTAIASSRALFTRLLVLKFILLPPFKNKYH